MDSIPLQLQTEFETLLRNRSVPTGLHPLYKKWLRFYLDFCQKYRFPETERKSLDHFLWKSINWNMPPLNPGRISAFFYRAACGGCPEAWQPWPCFPAPVSGQNKSPRFRLLSEPA